MSRTRWTASSSCGITSRKCRVSPCWAAAKTMPQRSRTVAAVSSSRGWSFVEGTSLDAVAFLRIEDPGWREIAGGLLRLDLDRRVERHQPIRDRDLRDDLDPLRCERVSLQVRHRHPAVDAADPEPVEDIRHQLLKPHVLHPGDTFGAAEVGVGAVAARLALTGVVDEEFGDFAERPSLLAVVNDDPDPALLGGVDADLDAVHEIGAAGADVGAEHVRAVAFVMDAAGDDGAGFGDLLHFAKEIDRHAANWRQQDLDVGPGHELGEHPPGLLEQGAPQIGFGNPKAGGQSG